MLEQHESPKERRQELHGTPLFPRRAFLGVAASAACWPAVVRAAPAQPIRIGQIGTEHAHAAGKMATMRKFNDHFEVVGVVESDDKQRRRVQETGAYRGVRWMSEAELLATEGLQVVAVETRVEELVATARRSVAAGAHVHLDKPAGDTLSDFALLLDEATAQGLVVQLGYMYRYNPAFQFLFKAVHEGWLGEVFEVHAVMSKKVDSDARKRLARFRGGAMFELGCHLIDAVVTLLGAPEAVTPYNRKSQLDKTGLLDNCLAVFEYPRATATVRSALIEVDGMRRRQFVVCGDQGTISIRPLEPPQLTLTLESPRGTYHRGTQQVELPVLGGRYDGDFLDLAQIVRGEKAADFLPQHDLAVQRAILQASGLEVR